VALVAGGGWDTEIVPSPQKIWFATKFLTFLPQTGHVQEALDSVVSGYIVRKGCCWIVVCRKDEDIGILWRIWLICLVEDLILLLPFCIFNIRSTVGRLMSRPPYPTYPQHHPHHGRPFIVIYDHDVLCGRGVNIAQHPGNERFRTLVNTRFDESYCTTYTTSEKRALAEEIIKHINCLDPPGRFLKRCGRSQTSRGLNGPWEELSLQESIKKTCQALRDCNRTDRTGYAAQVAVPQDVQDNAEKRKVSGLSLKEHAAAAVAKANPATLHPHHLNLNPPPLDQLPFTTTTTYTSFTRPSNGYSPPDVVGKMSPSVDNAAEWLKRQRTADSYAGVSPSSNHLDPVLPPLQASAPASHSIAAAPSINHSPYQQFRQPHSYHLQNQGLASPPPLHSGPAFHHDPQAVAAAAAVVAPYSPVRYPHSLPMVSSSEVGETPEDTDNSPHDLLIHHDHQHHQTDQIDILQSAADAAAALVNSPLHQANAFSLDEVPPGSLGSADL
jgi:hypothetical protein